MAKILLVEDDNNLREIYEARLQAEGYDIVAARDGEEALTVAMKERPDLIISDVMMPKISGFDMLDIIRSTEETKDVKVIMMTALSQAEDKARADKLGADRYLVKSQVTLEDVAKVAREVLNGANTPEPTPGAPPDPVTTPAQSPIADPVQVDSPVAPPPPTVQTLPLPQPAQDDPVDSSQQTAQDPVASSPAMAAVSTAEEVQSLSQSTEQEQADITAQIDSFIDTKKPVQEDTASQVTAEPKTDSEELNSPTVVAPPSENSDTSDDSKNRSQTGKKIISPINDPTTSKGPDLEKLLEKEAEKDQMAAIAQDIAAKNNSNGGESPSEEALHNAAVDHIADLSRGGAVQDTSSLSQNTDDSADEDSSETAEDHVQQVAISEDGNLAMASEQPEPEVQHEQMNYEETPTAPSTPNIPHTNGTSIDGVSTSPQQQVSAPAQSTTNPPVQQPEPTSPAPGDDDPNSIAL